MIEQKDNITTIEAIGTMMDDNKLKCKVVNDSNNSFKVILRNDAIKSDLRNVLSEQDIENGMYIVNKRNIASSIQLDLYNGCNQIKCNTKDRTVFRSIPNGSITSEIMFINKQPTQYDILNMTSCTDAYGVFLSTVLDKLNINREDVYWTDAVKCDKTNGKEDCMVCINNYLKKEIELVSPKIIICNGLELLRTMGNILLEGLPNNITYGTIYNVGLKGALVQTKIMAICDLNIIISKTGTECQRYKRQLWGWLIDVVTAIKETNQNK